MQHVYTLEELAKFLNRPLKDVKKLAEKEILKGRKVQGEWTFALADVVLWMEHEMTQLEVDQTAKLESAVASSADEAETIDLTSILDQLSIELNVPARTKSSVISEIVKIGERTGKLWDPDAMAEAIRQREEMSSTSMENGVAILHPRRPQPNIIAEDFLVLGITSNPVPFGGGFDNLTDVFFMLCCQTDTSYLRTLGKLARIIKSPDFLDTLRKSSTPEDVLSLFETAEQNLI